MVAEVLEKPASVEPVTCIHHWVIASPEGPTSQGTCRNCGSTREFPNAVVSPDWRYEPAVPSSSIDAALDLARKRMYRRETFAGLYDS